MHCIVSIIFSIPARIAATTKKTYFPARDVFVKVLIHMRTQVPRHIVQFEFFLLAFALDLSTDVSLIGDNGHSFGVVI